MHRAMIIGATLLALAGCNTVSGFGRDVSAIGNALTSASNEAARPAPDVVERATRRGHHDVHATSERLQLS